MFRNLVLKLPMCKCRSDYALSSLYRERTFRSLSPVQRLRPDAVTERSMSCSRAETGNSIANISGKPQSRTLSFSKEYYAKVQQPDSDEIQWNESEMKLQETSEVKEESSASFAAKPDTARFETLEQYELEAARPPPSKNRDLIDAFSTKYVQMDRCMHLQPNQMRPYGSSDSLYSPVLIRPTNSVKYPRKFDKFKLKNLRERKLNSVEDMITSRLGQRSFSTLNNWQIKDTLKKKLSTTKNCIAKEKHSNDYKECGENLKLSSTMKLAMNIKRAKNKMTTYYDNHWINNRKHLDFSPPTFQNLPINLCENMDFSIETSTPEMKRLRREKQNLAGSVHYKSCYSDLVKLKLQDSEQAEMELKSDLESTNSLCKIRTTGQQQPTKSNHMLQMLTGLSSGKRLLTTRSKSNFSKGSVKPEDRNYAKRKSKESLKTSKQGKYNPECQDICTSAVKADMQRSRMRRFPLEPEECKREHIHKIYLPSKIKLPVAHCLTRPEYQDCKKQELCDIERADECLVITPKQLPKIPLSPCPCVDPYVPTVNPKLPRLRMKFEDPPKAVCDEPPCQIPRADDSNPYKYKPLKPYVGRDCPCVEPPLLQDVKLKRLPRCEPEEVCRPVRVCPILEPCPPRADDCYKVLPKKLPPLNPSNCPCIDEPPPQKAPPIKRLDLHVPEPQRVCPPPAVCDESERADYQMKVKKKKLPKFVPGDCPCEDKPLVDWNLKRLICTDEPVDCIVPDPCKSFPRADWGCWEYPDEICEVVDERCVEKEKTCDPPKKEKSCKKQSICENAAGGLLNYRNGPKRKFSNASNNSMFLKLYETKRTKNYPSNVENISTKTPKTCKSDKKVTSNSAIHMVKLLNNLEKSNVEDPLLFKPVKIEKINYKSILKKIATTNRELEKKDPTKANSISNQTFKKSKQNTLRVVSRAISTTQQRRRSEQEIRKAKDCKAKETCKNLKPTFKTMICRKPCPKYIACQDPGHAVEHRPSCRYERVPVCCQKEESPYSAYSDNVPKVIQPFVANTGQWTCNRPQYGFHPVYENKFDPLKAEKEKNKNTKKQFSTSALLDNLPLPENSKHKEEPLVLGLVPNLTKKDSSIRHGSGIFTREKISGIYRPATKEFLRHQSTPILSSYIRPFATRIFQIRLPEPCKKPKPNPKCSDKLKRDSPKITCYNEKKCVAKKDHYCEKPYQSPCKVRQPPPFLAFSDCLDEEMEDILTECPLDKEKYHSMQPRYRYRDIEPYISPPPVQGKLDLSKEQECIRKKFDLEKGVTQSCHNFGQPVPLLKTKDFVKEENADCKRQEELKRKGRWPMRTLKSNYSKFFSTYTCGQSKFNVVFSGKVLPKNISQLNSIKSFHVLTKNADRTVLANNFEKIKDVTQKILPVVKEPSKPFKLRIDEKLNYQHLKEPAKVFNRAIRNYSTFKRKHRKCSKKKITFARMFSNSSSLLRRGGNTWRSKRSIRGTSIKLNQNKRRCMIIKGCPKFTLKSCPRKKERKACKRSFISKDCSKPFSPYPAFSECSDHEIVDTSCECPYDLKRMPDLQPRLSSLHQPVTIVKEFPTQEKIDRTLGANYAKCKDGIPNEGQTINCETFGFDCKKKNIDKMSEGNIKKSLVEFLVQLHKKDKTEETHTTCCSQSPEEICENNSQKLSNICMSECLKEIPCDLPEEEKYCLCKLKCEKVAAFKMEECMDQLMKNKEKPCEKPKEELKKKVSNYPQKNLSCPTIPPPPCPKSRTHVDTIWQKVVNYFKARPNCPQPGDYKKKALRDRAEKAAKAAGLVVVDLKCLPSDLIQSIKAATKSDCKVCPNQDTLSDPLSIKMGNRSGSPNPNNRSFSTSFQPARSYSKSCKNLEEINKIIEEGEIQKRKVQFGMTGRNNRNEFGIFPVRKDEEICKAMKLSLDKEMHKIVDFCDLYFKNGRFNKTYFGYSNIVPSRENILERAWRISIEAYRRFNDPGNYNFSNELFIRVNNSIKSMEDLG
ncbi:hypothetical protein ABEB36_000703 [Hypothenemus hampei]|uniref:Uncharacterized protein n=1 Tax=Hypothenemus hampei TaxID=57062 RepID=A0ABD1FET6_HYPHA